MTTKKPHLLINEALPAPTARVYEVKGGAGTYPRTDYAQHAGKIYKEAAQLNAFFAKVKDSTLSDKVFFKIQTPEDVNLWTGKGSEIEKKIHAEIVGSPAKNIGYVSTNKSSFSSLVEQIERYNSSEDNKGKSNFAQIEKISEVTAEEKISSRYKTASSSSAFNGEALISLFPNLTSTENANYKALISKLLVAEKGAILNECASDDGLILKVKGSKEMMAKIAESILAVQSVDTVDELFSPSSSAGENIESSVIVGINNSNAAACIFDTGVATTSRFISGSLIGEETPLGPPRDRDHGTFVASRIIYGDTIRDQVALGSMNPDVKVLSVCVFPHDGIGNKVSVTTEKLIETVRMTVERWYKKIRVYNLSLNLQSPDPTISSSITDDTVNPLAAELDNLAHKYDVLFVISAGNFPAKSQANPTEPYPYYFQREDSRISPPAEANLALTVGSLSNRENGGSLAKKGFPSPFTRRGPGFGGYRKPDLIAHGGNFAANWNHMDDLSVAGIHCTQEKVSYSNGTSHAAPLVTRLAAHLFSNIPNSSSALIRAMIIHFTDPISMEGYETEHAVNLSGNGVPNSEKILNSSQWEQSYLYQGEVDYRMIHKIPFYVPEGLTNRKGRSIFGIRITVAFNSETSRTLKSGYCKTHLRVNLHKKDSKGNLVQVANGTSIINVNDMYSTVIRKDIPFSRGVSHGDWEVSIEQITRWNLKNEKTKFGIVITLIDLKKDKAVDIHSMIQTEVPNRYKSELKIPQNIRL